MEDPIYAEYDDTIDNIIDDYISENDIVFELRAINGDGDVLVKYTGASGDDVSGYASLLDEQIEKLALENEESKLEQDAEIQSDLERGK